jgi:EAL domain-containing protein (putative c-di-GMP-specific phosphodiesterase class I)
LSRAVANQEFILHYQPKYSLSGERRVVGVEALMRWQHPDGRLLPPAEFISILEEMGLIVDVGEWLLQAGCSELRRWTNAGFADLRLAINVSSRQFESDVLVPMVRKALLDWAIAGERLEVEITEDLLLRDSVHVRRVLTELAELGVRIAIDDYGTGYSSLQSLKSVPVCALKIDGSFVRDIDRGGKDAAVAGAIIALGKALDLEVVAEGVETASQLAVLAEQGCAMVQGYFVGQPKSAPELTQQLNQSVSF